MNSLILLVRKLYFWTLAWANHPHSAKALSALSFFEASLFPIPVDPLLLALGFTKPKKSFYYAFLTTFFSVLGAVGGYFIGVYAWQFLSPFFFQYIFSENTFDKVSLSLSGATFISIFVAGFSPIPFKIFTISAGVVAAPFMPFVLASILSRGLRYFILATIIYFWGARAQAWIELNFEKMTIIVSLILVLTLVLIKFIF
jgi:membrane protein YqaA with SNARE-associated domain